MALIMVVDDESSMRRVLRKTLEQGGMDVVEAGSAGEAMELVDREPDIGAVVTDVLMPGISGVDFYDQLIARAPRLQQRVVFLTGAAHDPAVHTPIERRGVPLISKLDDLRLVLDAVRLALLRN
jgi:CheY-like chemotaxis protein